MRHEVIEVKKATRIESESQRSPDRDIESQLEMTVSAIAQYNSNLAPADGALSGESDSTANIEDQIQVRNLKG